MAKTSAACFSSSLVKKSGAGSFWSTHHHFTTCASRPSSSTLSECRMPTTLRSECPSRKSPRAADPYKITHSRFAAANSFSLRTNSASFASMESISNPLLSPKRYQLPEAPPPPLLPPPNPPNPPPPEKPPELPPNPPPPRQPPPLMPPSIGPIHQPPPPRRPPPAPLFPARAIEKMIQIRNSIPQKPIGNEPSRL